MKTLSICIPAHNCNITELIQDLHLQLNQFEIESEIVIIDDASDEKYKLLNGEVKSFDNVNYVELDKNVGRSTIRNLFLAHTRFENLLFLDCDSQIVNTDFVSYYINFLSTDTKVVCGGRTYSGKPKKSKYLLRWKYGIYRECKKANERAKNPYLSFMTNNFIVNRSILETIKFEERLTGYGHEDSLFGYQLMRNDAPIKHIDNPTIHNYNETSGEFLEKTRQGIENLLFIHIKLLPNSEFLKINKLLATYKKAERKKLVNLFSLLSYPLLPLFAALFRAGIVYLWCFDIYKLLYLCRIATKTKTNHLV